MYPGCLTLFPHSKNHSQRPTCSAISHAVERRTRTRSCLSCLLPVHPLFYIVLHISQAGNIRLSRSLRGLPLVNITTVKD